MFVVFEGIDGTGKTTIVSRLAEELKRIGYKVVITQEPTKTWLGRDVRRAIEEEKNGFTQALLFFADRAEHIANMHNVNEQVILCDRYVYSTFAYQGAQLEMSMPLQSAIEWLEKVYEPMRFDPDLVFLIKVNPEEGIRRIYGRERKEKFEKLEFLRRVQEIYQMLSDRYGFVEIDGNREFEEIYMEIKNRVINELEAMA